MSNETRRYTACTGPCCHTPRTERYGRWVLSFTPAQWWGGALALATIGGSVGWLCEWVLTLPRGK